MSTLEVIDCEATVQQLRGQWSRLAAGATPMQSPEWMLAWWRAQKTSQDRLAIITVRSSTGELIGLLPWYRQTRLALGTTLRFLGAGRAASDYQTVLCQSGTEEVVVDTLAQWLCGQLRCPEAAGRTAPALRWDLLDLEGVSAGDAKMQTLLDKLAARGHVTHFRPTESTWRIDLSGGWDGFMSRQSKTQRSQTRNFVNRFDKSDDLRLRVASEELPHADALVAALIELHQLRWQAVGVEGTFTDPRMKSFFQEAMREMIAGGLANVVVLERSGRPVAAQAWLVQGGSIYAYQSGRDPAEDANRVGRIANSVALRWACAQGFQAIDYLRGDEGYKAKMRAEPTPSYRVRVVARASVPVLRHKLWLACREAKSRLEGLGKARPAESQVSAAAHQTREGECSAEEQA